MLVGNQKTVLDHDRLIVRDCLDGRGLRIYIGSWLVYNRKTR